MLLNDAAFMLYAMECEGETDTHEGKVNSFIKQLNLSVTPWDTDTQKQLLAASGLRPEDLCPRDLNKIHRETGEYLCPELM